MGVIFALTFAAFGLFSLFLQAVHATVTVKKLINGIQTPQKHFTPPAGGVLSPGDKLGKTPSAGFRPGRKPEKTPSADFYRL